MFSNILNEHRFKNAQQNTCKPNPYIKRIIHHSQAGVIPETQIRFDICSSINVINHINELKDKNHMISQQTPNKKTFGKICHPFMLKVQENVWIQGKYLTTIKAPYEKLTANIILNGEKRETTSWKSGPKEGYPLSPLLFTIVPTVLAGAVKQENKMMGIQIAKEVKLSQFDDIIEIPKILPENFQKQQVNSAMWKNTESTYTNQQSFYTQKSKQRKRSWTESHSQ